MQCTRGAWSASSKKNKTKMHTITPTTDVNEPSQLNFFFFLFRLEAEHLLG